MRSPFRVPVLARAGVVIAAVALVASFGAGPRARASGTWSWPLTGPIVRGFDPPGSPYGSGHRGIDIGAPIGTPIRAPAPGTVTFAGKVAGHLFLTIAHGGNVSSTYSWIADVSVKKGDAVARGEVVGHSGGCHPGDVVPCLHLGVKLGSAYVDPLDYLAPLDLGSLIRLAPLSGP
jgi:murein DD-endopeptidase MepM/ murein hydrolase activator NlpD